MNAPLVIYHDNCPDGFTAAWAVWKALGDGAEYRGFNYGNEPPLADAKDRRVILVDFSWPREKLFSLLSVAESVEIYDHHKTAQADLQGWVAEGLHVVFDVERSGAAIAWDAFHPKMPRPMLVWYVQDRDLWQWRLNDSREVSEYLFSFERTFLIWDQLQYVLDSQFGHVVMVGSALLRSKRNRVAQICKNARMIRFGDLEVPVVNTSWDMSDVGEYMNARGHAIAGYYFDRADGRRQWGFRSVGDADCAALCQRYGGGGHKTAAGFTSESGWLP